MSEPVTEELYEEWRFHPITVRLLTLLKADRENMKEGLVQNAFDNEDEVKGRCRAIAILLTLDYKDLALPTKEERRDLDD